MSIQAAGTHPSPEGGTRAERILQEAARLFAEAGYAGTRMTDIAAAIGVTKPIIYRHFESKQVLFDHWVSSSLGARAREAATWIEANRERPHDVLQAIAAIAVDLVEARTVTSIWRIAIGEADRFPQLPATVHQVAVGPVTRALAAALASGQSSGKVRANVEPQVLADLVIAPLVGHAMLLSSFGTPDGAFSPMPQFARAHVDSLAAHWLA